MTELASLELEAALALLVVLDDAELAERDDATELVVDEASFAGTVPSPVGVFACCLVCELFLTLSA